MGTILGGRNLKRRLVERFARIIKSTRPVIDNQIPEGGGQVRILFPGVRRRMVVR
jgi:hypothetical protein